ncbi:MAG TPA: GNAT family N-acetyltransferase [Marinagarivorans sp.]
MGFLIQAAHKSQCAALVELVNRAYRPVNGEAGWTHESDWVAGHRIDAPAMALLIRGGGICVASHAASQRNAATVLGCVHYALSDQDEGVAHIGLLAVEPRAQEQGLGRQLMLEAERLAAQQGAYVARISVVNARNSLLAYYQRRGYCATGSRYPYPVDSGVGTPKKRQPLYLLELEKPL